MPQKDYIVLTGLKVSCIIGIFDWERKQKQDVLIDLKFPCDIRKAARKDRISDTVDYKRIAKTTISFVEKSRFQLIETLAEELARLLLHQLGLSEVFLSVSKPGAIRGSQNVGIQIHRTKSPGPSQLTFFSLGSNIQPKQNLEKALEKIAQKYSLAGLSHVYQTSPVGYAKQPAFWNLVAAVESSGGPEAVRKWIGQLEKSAGRKKNANINGPRTLDVDLILWGGQVKRYRDFTLPHPDIQTKAFVLFPLLEIGPNFRHPATGQTWVETAALFNDPSQKIRQLPAETLGGFPPQALTK